VKTVITEQLLFTRLELLCLCKSMIGLAWIVLIHLIFLCIDYHYRSAIFVYSLAAVFVCAVCLKLAENFHPIKFAVSRFTTLNGRSAYLYYVLS
jgi:hypothetical protein